MKTILMILTMAAACTLGCGGGPSVAENCADFCDKSGECDGASDAEISQCKTDCEAEINEASSACKSSFEDVTDCFSGTSCAVLNDPEDNTCVPEALVFIGECGDFSEASLMGDLIPDLASRAQ